MDYRALLKAYMAHVLTEESVTFLEYQRPEDMDDEDFLTLLNIRDEVEANKLALHHAWIASMAAEGKICGKEALNDPDHRYEVCTRSPHHEFSPCRHDWRR